MRARFIFGCVAMVAACKSHERARGAPPGPAGSAAPSSAADNVIARLGARGGSVYPGQLVARDDGGFVLVAHVHGKLRIADVDVAQTDEYHPVPVVLALDAGGRVRWAHPLDPKCADDLQVATHGTQTIVVGGCPHKLDAPKDDATPVDPYQHVVVGVLDDTGAVVWAKQAGDPGAHTNAKAVAVDPDGTLYVGGLLYAPADLGRGRIELAKHEQAGFVAAYAADGKPLWVTTVPNADIKAVVVGGDEVDIAGTFKQATQLGATKLAAPHGARFVARMAKTSGEVRGAVKVGDNGSLHTALARASSGALYLVYDDDLDGADFLVSIDAANQPKELHRYSNGHTTVLGAQQSVAVDASGAVWLAAAFDHSLDFGSGALTAAGAYDAVVAKYAPDGTLLATKTPFPTVTDESLEGLALTKAGPVVALQSLAGPSDKPYGQWLVDETYGLTSLVRIAP